jgi:RNA-directed DNA polymerase
MATQLALTPPFLLKLAASASHRYKEYKIPKKTGGERTIHHPAREIKLLQYWLLRNLVVNLPVHPLATAYRKESSIRENAALHVANNYILRVDFNDFFHSLKGSDVVSVLAANRQRLADEVLTDLDIRLTRQIVCRLDCLTIGAPTSPVLSNAIMFEFDVRWSEMARTEDVTYSRYADDLYFSTNRPNVLESVLERLRESLRAQRAPTLTINDRKTSFSSRKRRRLAAGLVLTSDRKISIGRKKKRRLKALVNNLKRRQLPMEQMAHLRGWIAYLGSVEPAFVTALEKKYDLDFKSNITWEV